jgi:hypothetical protein
MKAEAGPELRQPESVELAGQPHDAYVSGLEATPAAVVAFAVNWTA